MGKAVLIVMAAVMLAGAYYAFGDQRAQYETQAQQAEDEYLILARNGALMGLDRTEQKLADNFQNYANVAGSYDGVTYEASAVTNPADTTVVVRSTGTAQTRESETVTFDIRAKYKQEQWILEDPPPFMRYVLISEGDIRFQGNFSVHAYSPSGGSSAPLNANVHTNSALRVNSNATIEGFGTYVVGVTPDQTTASASFFPNDNPLGSDHVYQTSPVEIPPLDPAAMASALTVDSTTSGNVTITSQADLAAISGTREDPYIWHIQGDLVFNADVSITDYAIFLVDGNLDFKRNVTTPEVSYDGEDEGSLAFYVGSLAKISGNLEIWGQIFANSAQIDMTGSAVIYGGIVTRSTLDLGGGADFHFRQVSSALTRYFQGGENDRLVRIAYSEW